MSRATEEGAWRLLSESVKQEAAARREADRLWAALAWLDTFSPEDVAAAEERFGLDVSRATLKPEASA